jgi:hypothetical protein
MIDIIRNKEEQMMGKVGDEELQTIIEEKAKAIMRKQGLNG